MKMKKANLILIVIASILSIGNISCTKNDDDSSIARKFGIFKVINDTTAEMNGVINGSTPRNFNRLIRNYPNIKVINMLDCPGSMNDEANLQVSRTMHDKGISFHLFSTSVIASGAVDMYVGGLRRTRDAGSKIGVHSWGGEPGDPIATEYPADHEVHQLYINYYVSVGFTQQESEDFYFFTINAALADDIYWMTDTEIEQYKVTKD